MLADMHWFVGLILLVVAVYGKNEQYDGHSLYEVTVQDVDQSLLVNQIEAELDVDAWSHALPSRPGYVLVPGNQKQIFEDALSAAGIEYQISVENIKDLIDEEEAFMQRSRSKPLPRSVSEGLPFDRIYTYDEIYDYLDKLAAAYPNIVTWSKAGESFEGRPIKYLKISTTNFEDKSKPIVMMESLIHAREWVTQPATLYAIHKLVIDVTEQDLLQDIDWIIVPVVNPDGYIHTHDRDRFWRKNRATGYMITNLCSGVDLNRNFDVFWSQASSNVVCQDTFHGRSAFSEPETSAVRDILLEHVDRVELFLDIHSFGSMILFGYGNGVMPPNALFLNLVGVRMASAIDAVKMPYNSNYIVGNTAMVLYPASGVAPDYAQSVGVPLAYTFELPARRGASNTILGFLVNDDFIEQAGFETWEGIKAGARYVRDNHRRRRGAAAV